MRRFTGPEIGILRDLISRNFNPDSFDMFLLIRLNKPRYNITMHNDFKMRIFSVLQVANEELWQLEFLNALLAARPRDNEIQSFSDQFINRVGSKNNLEVLVTQSEFIDPAVARSRFNELENRICRIEISFNEKTGFGTGFLVGPDRVMTNYHVLKPILDNPENYSKVVCRFDFKKSMDGQTIYKGTKVKMSSDFPILAKSSYSQKDLQQTPMDQSWGENELDFVLFKLEKPIGKEPPGPFKNGVPGLDPEEEKRGWIKVAHELQSAEPKKDLIIFQHPKGDTIKFSIGRLLDPSLNKNKTRFRYDTNTQGGSSGSPCFNSKWQWIGIHHAGDPDWMAQYNQGIPVKAILDSLSKNSITL